MKKTVILLSILLAIIATAFVQTGSLKGTITDKSGNNIAHASVVLMQNGKFVKICNSDTRGTFIVNDVPAGTYTIKVAAKGFDELEKKVTLIAGKAIIMNLQMIKEIVKPLIIDLKDEDRECEAAEQPCAKVNRTISMSKAKKSGSYSYAGGMGYSTVSNMDGMYQDYNTESYDVINENEFKASKDNPLSTFSVDVDNASYSNMRRFLNSNQLPPKDAIRIEEMINYFSYDYTQPTDGHPFSVNMELGDCPWNTSHKLVHIGLKGQEIDQSNIPSNNLVFLMDVSGSMGSPNKLPLLKKAFTVLVDKLRPSDRVAMVVYAGAAGLVLESTPGNQKETIVKALNNLNSGGSTAGGAGINLAYKVAKENFIQNGNNRVILATDGDFNVGASSDGEMVRLIEEKRDDGIFLTVLGFGMGNYQDSKMEKISNAGNGNYAYIDNIMEAKKVLGEEIWGTLYTIAKDVKLQIEFNPAQVEAYRLIGYENRMLNKEDFNDDKKDAGEIGVGHTVTALYEIIPAGVPTTAGSVDDLKYQSTNVIKSNDLMTLKLRYKRPESDVSKLIEKQFTSEDLKAASLSNNLMFSAAVAEFGMMLRDSKHKSSASYNQVLQLANNAKGKDESGYRAEFIKLVKTAQTINDTATK